MQARDIVIFLVIYALTMSYFILKTYGNSTLFSIVIAFAIMAAGSFIAALYTKVEEEYYADLTFSGLLNVFVALVAMIFVSSLLTGIAAQSVLYYPTVFTTLGSIGAATSVFTAFLGEFVFQLSAVATGEESLKFIAYSALKSRYGRFLATVLAVGFWAGFHAIRAYSNILLIIPAFICGIILVCLLEYTKSLIAPIIAHGVYNSICFINTFKAGALMPLELPWFPIVYTSEDILLVGLAAMWIAFIFLPIILRYKK